MSTNEAALKLARVIAADGAMNPTGRVRDMILAGKCDDWHGVKAALAAILEVTERAAALAERIEDAADDDWNAKYDMHDQGRSAGACEVTTALRNLEHLA